MIYYIRLFSKIRWSLTYLPTLKSEVIYGWSLTFFFLSFFQITNQVKDIENGHLPKVHQDQALKDLEKRSKSCSEAWMKILENLDSIQLEESQTLARSKRKSIVNLTNSNMDGADDILHRIKNLKEKSVVN